MKRLGKKLYVRETIEAYQPVCKNCICYCGDDYFYTYDKRFIEKEKEGYIIPL